MEIDNSKLVQEVQQYFRSPTAMLGGIAEVAELGDGIIAVKETDGECSAYFNPGNWRVAQGYDADTLGILPSGHFHILEAVHLQGIEHIFQLVQQVLESTDESVTLYDTPRPYSPPEPL